MLVALGSVEDDKEFGVGMDEGGVGFEPVVAGAADGAKGEMFFGEDAGMET